VREGKRAEGRRCRDKEEEEWWGGEGEVCFIGFGR